MNHPVWPPSAQPFLATPSFPPPPAPIICVCGGIPISVGVKSQDTFDASPFKHHLKTNYAPSSDEQPQIRTIMNQHKAEIQRTTQRIEDLRQEIVRLCQENAPRIAFVEEHEALLAPIRQLPVDILREIFYHCVSSGMVGSMHKDDAPMVLTRVCNHWREVALSTPRLWSSIHIVVPQTHHPQIPETGLAKLRILGISEWISRSAQAPLHLSIYQADTQTQWEEAGSGFGPDVNSPAQKSMNEILDIIRPSIRRCNTLHLTCPFPSAQLLFAIPGSEWVSIQEVRFYHNVSGLGFASPAFSCRQLSQPGQGPFCGPHLSKVTLCRMPYVHDPFLYTIPWERITHLCISGGVAYASPMPYFDLLRGIQDTIESLELLTNPSHSSYQAFYAKNGMPPIDVIVLPRLKRLVVKEIHASFTLLGKTIRCPRLMELEYDEANFPWMYSPPPSPPLDNIPGSSTAASPQPSSGDPVSSLITLLSHSGVFLDSIAFNYFRYNNQELLEIFTSIPLIRVVSHLGPYGGRFQPPSSVGAAADVTTKDVLSAFVTSRDGPSEQYPLCPLLRKLAWGTVTVSDADFLEFLELKQSGIIGVAKLDAVAIHFTALSEERYKKMVALLPRSNPPQVFITCDPVVVDRGSGIRDGLSYQSPTWPVATCRF